MVSESDKRLIDKCLMELEIVDAQEQQVALREAITTIQNVVNKRVDQIQTKKYPFWCTSPTQLVNEVIHLTRASIILQVEKSGQEQREFHNKLKITVMKQEK